MKASRGMTTPHLYPLRFEPIHQYRPWGSRRLARLFPELPDIDTIGEAWLLSDRNEQVSIVTNGPLKGRSLGELLSLFPLELLGKGSRHFDHFPLLLKYLDVRTQLSVQVHPSDAHPKLIPAGDTGKTEAWIVIEAGPAARVFAGWKASVSPASVRAAIANGTVAELLASFTPKPGDAILIPAGTVHSLSDVVVFEAQQNSDVTFRLYDWDHIDPRTGERRALQIDEAMACITFEQGAVDPIAPIAAGSLPRLRETLVECEQFGVTRIRGSLQFHVGTIQEPSVLVCLSGKGSLEHGGRSYPFAKSDLLLLPAIAGRCLCQPQGMVTVLEISLQESLIRLKGVAAGAASC
jgi:mannose-6-phosphate isomerase